MVEVIEIEAKSIDEAVNKACLHFSVPREKLSIEILADASSGFLGIGARKARILARLLDVDFTKGSNKNTDPSHPQPISLSEEDEREYANRGRDFLLGLLKHMKIERGVSYKITEESIILIIDGASDPLLIGKMGKNLDAIQHIVSKATDKEKRAKPIVVEMGNYRNRRRSNLVAIANSMGEKVRRSHKKLTVKNMNAHDRKIIHMTLEKNPHVTTRSVGENSERILIIEPIKKRRRGAKWQGEDQ